MGEQRLRGGDEVAEVGAVGRLGLRRAHAEEVQFGAGRVGEVRGEAEPAGGDAVAQELVQPGFEERRGAAAQLLDFAGVDVDPHHGVAHRREGGRVHGSQVPAADHGNFHRATP